jgi:murein DD-endopeptidase MepM/ murein hydrolase activator NlpD
MSSKKPERILGLALAGALLGAAAVLAGGSPAELGASYVPGPAQVTDELNGVTLDVPKGWYAIVPSKGLSGTTTLANYDMGHAEDWLPEHSAHALVKEIAKIDVLTFDLGTAGTVGEWVEQRLAQGGVAGEALVTSEKIEYRMAGRKGLAYVLHRGFASSVEIALPWEDGKVLLTSVHPIDSIDLQKALAIAEGLRPAGEDRPRVLDARNGGSKRFAPLQALVRHEISRSAEIEKALGPAKAACTGWTGTDNGACAAGHSCASNASITLYLPFQWQTWWQAGGVGSFFGNQFHGNCNNDYYAIDFNLYSSSSCSSAANDAGQNVYAAANGTAAVGFDSSGYGNYVLVTHSNGYKTRYAHLQSVNVANGAAVNTQTVVGFVGTTGASSAPHLHFGYQNGSVSYCNRAGGCPNGEAARSPQTQKPSPMQTNTGSRSITDFGCYQGPP